PVPIEAIDVRHLNLRGSRLELLQLIGQRPGLGQAICIDAARGTFVTGDVPDGVPVSELKDFVLIPATGDRTPVKAQLLGTDPEEKLTFLKVVGEHKWSQLTFTSSRGLKVGQRVCSVGLLGKQMGGAPYAGTAVIVAKLELPDEVIYVGGGDLTIGSSPVMTMDGRVVGIVGGQVPVTMRLMLRGGWVDASMMGRQATRFFIPTGEFAHVLKNIPPPGRPRKLPWLGVLSFEPIGEEMASATPGLNGRPAVMVGQVIPNTPATRAGVEQGDLIVGVGGTNLQQMPTSRLVASAFRRGIIRYTPGAKVSIKVLRGGKDITCQVTLAARPLLPNEAARYYSRPLGMAARDIVLVERYLRRAEPLKENGAVVTLAIPKSPSAIGKLVGNSVRNAIDHSLDQDHVVGRRRQVVGHGLN
ncbi:hypothetical protein LCGC14_2783220, partial [marine sediment metagenome]